MRHSMRGDAGADSRVRTACRDARPLAARASRRSIPALSGSADREVGAVHHRRPYASPRALISTASGRRTRSEGLSGPRGACATA